MQRHELHLLCAGHMLGPGDMAAKKIVKVPFPQGERKAINLRNGMVSVMGALKRIKMG